MKPLSFLVPPALAAAALLATAHAAPAYRTLRDSPAGLYRIDPDHSLVQFTIGHVGIVPVTGVFRRIHGTYRFDPGHPERDRATIVIPVRSLDTFVPVRDKDLLGPKFFDAARYPRIRFVSTSYRPTGPGRGRLRGRLTLHGITHPVVFDVRRIGAGPVRWLPKPWGGYLSGYIATTTIDRLRYGITADPGALSHDVRIRVAIEGVRMPRGSTRP